jgi:integrase
MPDTTQKPAKPYPDFPLFPHARGKWAAKIGGKLYYFGRWEDPFEALQDYKNRVDGIKAGRDPRKLPGVLEAKTGCTIMDLCNHFQNAKRVQKESGQLAAKTFSQYYQACDLIVKHFGKDTLVEVLRPADFTRFRSSFPDTWGLEMLNGVIGRVRSVFKFATDEELTDKTINFGTSFKRPDKTQKRKQKQAQRADVGRLDFTSDEARKLVESSGGWLKACILLGLNAGFGNTDCARLKAKLIDFKTGWLDYPRPKTAIERRVPLWPETLAAIREAIQARPIAKNPADDDLCFLTSHGMPIVWDEERGEKHFNVNNVTTAFGKLMQKLKMNKTGHNFYSLRRTFETIAGASKDQVAVDYIMGHADNSMAERYRQGIEDERLKATVDHVHAWLFPKEKKKPAKRKATKKDKPEAAE